MQSSVHPVFVIQFLHKVCLSEAVSTMSILCGPVQAPFLFIIKQCFLMSLSKLKLILMPDFYILLDYHFFQ